MKTSRIICRLGFVLVLILVQAVLVTRRGAPVTAQDSAVRIIFMHHSTGGGLIWEGGAREAFTALGYEFWDHGYNDEGLTDASGTALGINWDVPGDNTDPNGWPEIFNQPVTDPPTNTFSHMLEFDVIIFKSCFPNADIQSEEQFEQYRRYLLDVRDVMDQHPDKLFIPFTIPPLVPNSTTPEAAARVRRWAEYLTSPEYLEGHPNIAVFDFFSQLADEDGYLRAEYRGDEWDSHPNTLANQTVTPIFAEFVDQAIRSFEPGTPPQPVSSVTVGDQDAVLFDDFERPDEMDWWWTYMDERVTFSCEIGEGYQSAQALRLVYEAPVETSALCGMTFEPDQRWAGTKGLCFYWRADRPGLVARVGVGINDPAQATSGMEELTLFEVEMPGSNEEWSEVTLFWDEFAKPEWLSGSGADTFEPEQVILVQFSVGSWEEAQSGSIRVDDLQLVTDG